jgi:hypothetical protein
MPTRQAYYIRWEDGTCRTVQAHSIRGAAVLFCGTYAVPVGGTFTVQPSDKSEPATPYRRTSAGLRKLRS